MTDIRKAAEERYPHLAVGNMTARADFIVGAEWMREQAAQAADLVKDHYPPDLWPPVTSEHLAALHSFAKTLGMQDGSRFHVGGIRHGVTLAADAIRKIGENDD